MINTPAGLRIYGSGIVSSKGESLHCLESDAPNRFGFDLERIDTFPNPSCGLAVLLAKTRRRARPSLRFRVSCATMIRLGA